MNGIRLILAASALVALAAWPARADDPTSPTPLPQPVASGSNAVGACLQAGQVWLFVIDDQQRVLSNQCVGNPTSGEDALRLAGLVTTKARGGYLCTIGGYPEACPASFEGEFWNYHHTAASQHWTFSNMGAASRVPDGGTVEGWCYNQPDENRCTPPPLRIVMDGNVRLPGGVSEADVVEPAPLVRAPLPPPPPLPWGTVAGALAVVALGVGAVYFRRRGLPTQPTDDELGGR